MATMTMNKAIHCAVRRDLDRFINALQSVRPGDLLRARQLGTAWANFDAQLTEHHHSEHEIAWPALEALGISRDLLDTLDAEHATMANALDATRSAMATYVRTAAEPDAKAALDAFEHLRSVTVTHLDHEEAETEALLLDRADSPAVKEMGKKFSKVSPSQAGRFFAWVTDGAAPDELAVIKGNVPGPVLAVVGGIWGRSYRRDVAPVWRS